MSFTRSVATAGLLTFALAGGSLAEEPAADATASPPASVELAAGDALGLQVFAHRMAAEAAKPAELANADGVKRNAKR